MIINMICYRSCERSSRTNIRCNYNLKASSPVIYLRGVDTRYALSSQAAAVIGLTLLATSLSALFASFILGIFQGGISLSVADVRIIKISRLVAGSDKAAWDVSIGIKNSGSEILQIQYIDLTIGDEVITPISIPGTASHTQLTVMPGEQKILRVIIANYDPVQLGANNAVVFSDPRLSIGVMVSVRIIGSEGRTALINFTLQ